jgi:hypothetical protein
VTVVHAGVHTNLRGGAHQSARGVHTNIHADVQEAASKSDSLNVVVSNAERDGCTVRGLARDPQVR